MSEPFNRCEVCGAIDIVRRDGRGFPPDISRRRLVKRCAAAGHKCVPAYRAPLLLGPPAGGMVPSPDPEPETP